MPLIRDALSAIGPVGRFALLGAVSGSLATTLILAWPQPDHRFLGWMPFEWLALSPSSVIPGLVFGLLIGLALNRGGRAGPRTFAAYLAASTVSYFAAFHLGLHIVDHAGPLLLIGMIAGLLGSACLTGLAAWMFPFVRKFRPIVLMLFAGGVLGSLITLTDSFWGMLVFFAAWQAGYAAAFATALPMFYAPDSARVPGAV